MEKVILYHGSSKVIENPVFGEGKIYNNYGRGFYCTKEIELAKERASIEGIEGYANKYELDLSDLKILDLSLEKYSILNWIAILLENRIINLTTLIQKEAKDYIIKNFLPDYKNYDVIVGYRADDSYFMFARAFISNEISLSQLSLAMKLGKLGYQYCLKTEKAFNKIKFVDCISINNSIYLKKRRDREEQAKKDYFKVANKLDVDGIYIRDIIKEGMKDGDKRLRI